MNEKYFNENETEMWTFVGCVPNGSNSAPIMDKSLIHKDLFAIYDFLTTQKRTRNDDL